MVLFTLQRLAPVKRVDVLIRIMAEPEIRAAPIKLVVAGQGEESERLRDLARDLSVDRVVHFAGYVPNSELPAHFASADIFVFHSLMETFGVVAVQAMASCLPIVAARSAVLTDVVGKDGAFLAAPFDLRGFTDAVLALAKDPALREEMGRRNRARAVASFDWDSIGARYERALIAVANGRARIADAERRPA